MERRGGEQPCPWALASLKDLSEEERAAVAWIVAEAVMRQRCGPVVKAFAAWRSFKLSGTALSDVGQQWVTAFAEPVFKPSKATEVPQGVPGHVGEWLWYLLALESADVPTRVKEYQAVPKDYVIDAGADGLVIYRSNNGTGPELLFRLWEMRKYTGGQESISGTVTGAWQQLSKHGTRCVISQVAWADKHVSGDVGAFVSQLPELRLTGDVSSGAGVSVATNSSAAPRRAFSTAHTYLTWRTPGSWRA